VIVPLVETITRRSQPAAW